MRTTIEYILEIRYNASSAIDMDKVRSSLSAGNNQIALLPNGITYSKDPQTNPDMYSGGVAAGKSFVNFTLSDDISTEAIQTKFEEFINVFVKYVNLPITRLGYRKRLRFFFSDKASCIQKVNSYFTITIPEFDQTKQSSEASLVKIRFEKRGCHFDQFVVYEDLVLSAWGMQQNFNTIVFDIDAFMESLGTKNKLEIVDLIEKMDIVIREKNDIFARWIEV